MTGLATTDLVIDHAIAQVGGAIQFLLDVTPVNSDDVLTAWAAGERVPRFEYRDLQTDPDLAQGMLDAIDLDAVSDATLSSLLRSKHREMTLQLDMLRARDTEDFLPLSLQLYGGVAPPLREMAEHILENVPVGAGRGEQVGALEFHALALAEIEHYKEQDPDIEMFAEVCDDVAGVLVSGNTLLISADAAVQATRTNALLQHEVGTHLVTQVNGLAQPIRVLGAGLAGYDETQEGLAVLAEIACGQLTHFRLRQLAARVVTVHRLVTGASFTEAFEALTDLGFLQGSAFTTTMRAYRSGGLTKDAIYLRGLVELLAHVRSGGQLDLLLRGKFSLRDLPLIAELDERGVLAPPRLRPRYLDDPTAGLRIRWAAELKSLSELIGVTA
ncbi:flavohemoglobin expression-modulating QEGLA motif protein [Propioniciclava sinopodophylli]|uniref:flavohemoglobin expression-modulating QEGLA motif protein n=1 Tax=Propioniciclava sinopodophylli TaxID=1837344 RepID=UPI0024926301|nr:tyrosine/phenylalanine carboxypeptidase domain-containing protein [Propioniciclava sinopodophylli]